MSTVLDSVVKVHGRELSLRWTFGAMCEAEKLFNATPGTKAFSKKIAEYGEKHGNMRLNMVLGYCMLQSVPNPPGMYELDTMPQAEVGKFVNAVMRSLGIGVDGPFPAKKDEAPAASEAAKDGAASGTGAKRSRRRSSAAASRRPNSSGSRRSSST